MNSPDIMNYGVEKEEPNRDLQLLLFPFLMMGGAV